MLYLHTEQVQALTIIALKSFCGTLTSRSLYENWFDTKLYDVLWLNDQFTNDLIFSGHLPLTDQADIIIITHPNDVNKHHLW